VKEHADGSGDGDSQKGIMPLKLMLSFMILVLILSIADLGFAAVCQSSSPPYMSRADGSLKTWVHCLHVVPTRVVVLAPSKSKKTVSRFVHCSSMEGS